MNILTKAQAEAVYSAMCALNNVGGALWCRMTAGKGEEWVGVREEDSGAIHIRKGALRRFDSIESVVAIGTGALEHHASQAAFAAAYGLDHGGEPQSAVAAAAGGLTQTAIER